jgi:hypothetical protein
MFDGRNRQAGHSWGKSRVYARADDSTPRQWAHSGDLAGVDLVEAESSSQSACALRKFVALGLLGVWLRNVCFGSGENTA